jgi:hypothetical protein
LEGSSRPLGPPQKIHPCVGPKRNGRGDKTPLELFLAGVLALEAGLRRRMDAESSVAE